MGGSKTRKRECAHTDCKQRITEKEKIELIAVLDPETGPQQLPTLLLLFSDFQSTKTLSFSTDRN